MTGKLTGKPKDNHGFSTKPGETEPANREGKDDRRGRETSDAGGGIRTLKPLRAFVFETKAYTVPPHRLTRSLGYSLAGITNASCGYRIAQVEERCKPQILPTISREFKAASPLYLEIQKFYEPTTARFNLNKKAPKHHRPSSEDRLRSFPHALYSRAFPYPRRGVPG